MSKRLLLIRHAKSDWENNLADFERPLNKRGHKDATEMAERLLKKHLIPEQLVSSRAKRAITTAEYFADVLGIKKKKIEKEPAIYDASSSQLLSIVNKLDNDYDFIALFGHNPGLSGLAMNLSGNEVFDIPTCGMVLLKFPFDDWKMVGSGTGEMLFFDYPKNDG